MTLTLAARAQRMKPSAVREILKVAERPDILSFAGGLPAPELFPVDAIAKAHGYLESDDYAGHLLRVASILKINRFYVRSTAEERERAADGRFYHHQQVN